MAVSELSNLSAEFAKAVNSADVDAICDHYSPDAVFVTAPGAAPTAVGAAAIRQVLAGFLATRPSMEFQHEYLFESGDTALARGKWKLTSTNADGATETVEGTSIEVLRRGADGLWRYVIDHPWGGN